MKSQFCIFGMLLLSTIAIATGCGGPNTVEDPKILAQREEFMLTAAPKGMLAISKAKEAAAEKDEIVIGGRIKAGEHEPWEEGRAAFLVTDITLDAHKHHHKDGQECAFCKGASDPLESMATLRFLGEDGKVLPIDARKLLGVKENQVVVVKGKGEVDDLGQLTVSVNGIYLRR